MNNACGQRASMSRAIDWKTVMVRKPRKTPPGPSVSPTVWSMPYVRGISTSCAYIPRPPT